jgi:hypothetical protein
MPRATEAQHEAEDRYAARVAALLDDRDDLLGLFGYAELVVDGIRWSA